MIAFGVKPVPLVVFADLDHSLLDDRRCALLDRAPLAQVIDRDIPIVLCSKRTRPEVERIRRILGLRDPFICEDGAVLYVPHGYKGFSVPHGRVTAGYIAVDFGRPYGDIVDTLHRAAQRYRAEIIGFADVSVERLSIELRVPILHAQLAKLREFSEPFRFVDHTASGAARMLASLRDQGIGYAYHGTYIHAGPPVPYEAAAGLLARLFSAAHPDALIVVFGDNLRDGRLLELADIPLLIANGKDDPTAMRRFAPAARVSTINTIDEWETLVVDLAGAVAGRHRTCLH